ncbi:hypothetical protein BYT27DRAFT_6379806 [Phlegmacium glaucopus]|nr:hypothetical protein BYT27DRAFT_6379806 [Phlegmacium glaucopus]
MVSEEDAVFVTDDDAIRYLGGDPDADKKPTVLQYPQTLDKMVELQTPFSNLSVSSISAMATSEHTDKVEIAASVTHGQGQRKRLSTSETLVNVLPPENQVPTTSSSERPLKVSTVIIDDNNQPQGATIVSQHEGPLEASYKGQMLRHSNAVQSLERHSKAQPSRPTICRTNYPTVMCLSKKTLSRTNQRHRKLLGNRMALRTSFRQLYSLVPVNNQVEKIY